MNDEITCRFDRPMASAGIRILLPYEIYPEEVRGLLVRPGATLDGHRAVGIALQARALPHVQAPGFVTRPGAGDVLTEWERALRLAHYDPERYEADKRAWIESAGSVQLRLGMRRLIATLRQVEAARDSADFLGNRVFCQSSTPLASVGEAVAPCRRVSRVHFVCTLWSPDRVVRKVAMTMRISEVDDAVEPLLEARDVAALLRIPVSSVYEYARRGLIPHVRLGKHVRFVREDIRQVISEHRLG